MWVLVDVSFDFRNAGLRESEATNDDTPSLPPKQDHVDRSPIPTTLSLIRSIQICFSPTFRKSFRRSGAEPTLTHVGKIGDISSLTDFLCNNHAVFMLAPLSFLSSSRFLLSLSLSLLSLSLLPLRLSTSSSSLLLDMSHQHGQQERSSLHDLLHDSLPEIADTDFSSMHSRLQHLLRKMPSDPNHFLYDALAKVHLVLSKLNEKDWIKLMNSTPNERRGTHKVNITTYASEVCTSLDAISEDIDGEHRRQLVCSNWGVLESWNCPNLTSLARRKSELATLKIYL